MHHRQRGIALIEVLGVLMIAAMLLAGISSMVDTNLEDTKAQQTALYQTQMATAASRYLSDNYAAIAVGANLNQTLAVPLGVLQTASVLPPGMGAANPYGQTPCLLVRPRIKSALAPDTIVLDALVVTEGAAAQAIPERILAFAAANAGAGGGFISARSAGTAQGSSGAWSLSTATAPSLSNFTATRCSASGAGGGSLATLLYFDGPGQAADFLYRDKVDGMPSLNQMNTPIAMGAGAAVTAGAACTGAAIAVDASRNVMNCGGDNTWQQVASLSSWKEPVPNYDDLRTTPTPKDGDVRMVTSLGRAFTYMQASGQWTALAVDQNGDMTVPRDLLAGRNLNATGAATIGGDANVLNGVVTADGLHATEWAATPSIQVYAKLTPGSPCHIPSLDKNGLLVYIYPIGSLVLDEGTRSLMMICSGTGPGDAFFVYQSGDSSS